MFLISSFITSVTSVAVLVAGTLTLLRNQRRKQNMWFFALSVTAAIWLPANFFDNNITRPLAANIFLKIDFFVAPFLVWALVEFVTTLNPNSVVTRARRLREDLIRIFIIGINIFLGILVLDNLIAKDTFSASGAQIHYQHLFIPYSIVIISYLIYAFTMLFYFHYNSTAEQRNSLNLIIVGLVIVAAANILTDVILPLVFHSRIKNLNVIGYLGFLVYTVLLYLAITTKKFFDIRSFIVRSLAYLLSLVLLSFLFVTPIAIISAYFFHAHLKLTTFIYINLVTLLFGWMFAPMQFIFNKATNKIFYRNFYEVQDVLYKLNKVLVGTIDSEYIKQQSISIIQQSINPSFVDFKLMANSTPEERVLIANVINYKNIVIKEELDPVEYKYLYNAFEANDISLAVQLNTNTGVLGILVLGYKASGGEYDKKDRSLIGVIAEEITTTLQNALLFQQIKNFNIELNSRIERATAELKDANSHLQELDKIKDDFLSMATHQLNTPLVAVDGYISMVNTDQKGKLTKAQRDYLEKAQYRLRIIKSLVLDFLDVTRIEAGRFFIERSSVDLDKLVAEEVDQLEKRAKESSVILEYIKPTKPLPFIKIDQQKTRQAVMNLIDNAIFYTPNGTVRVYLDADEKFATFKVIDNGIGVPEAQKKNLFNKYFRADNAKLQRPNGNGIGLYLVKRVAEDQGGSIIFDSEEGKGSLFGFRLPYKQVETVNDNPNNNAPATGV